MDPYKTLGVDKNASQDEIKKAFRKKALEHHPDKGGSEEKFKQINEAYSMISDSNKRSHHDAKRDGFGRGFGFDFDFSTGSPFGDMFHDVFGAKRKASRPNVTTDEDILFDLRISLKQVKQGVRQTATFEKNVVCDPCRGQGGEGKTECTNCDGSGILIVQPNPFTVHRKTCMHCRGRGFKFTNMCSNCFGAGSKKIKDSISFIIKQI